MYFGVVVTLLVWIPHRLVSSERLTRYASLAAPWSAATAFKAQVGLEVLGELDAGKAACG